MNASVIREGTTLSRVDQRRPSPVPVLDASPVPHALLDGQHRLRWANPAWTRLTGTIATPGAPWLDWVHPEDLRHELPLIARLHDGALAAYDCRSRLSRAGGAWIPVTLRVARLAPDQILVAAELCADAPAAQPAGGGAGFDEHLAATLSHDFRQHLRLTTSYISLVERQIGETLTPRQRGHLVTACEHADRLQGMIVDLVRWMRLAHEELDGQQCSLDEVWRQVLEREAERIVASGAQITLPPSLPAVRGNHDLLCEAFAHLLRNAILYHGPGAPLVRVEAVQEEGALLLTVADDGPGIAEQDRARVLRPFLRLHSWEQVPGNGMGLTLARRIIERHGGTLRLEGGEQGGCVVQVRLPG